MHNTYRDEINRSRQKEHGDIAAVGELMKRPKNIMDTEPPHAPMPATAAAAGEGTCPSESPKIGRPCLMRCCCQTDQRNRSQRVCTRPTSMMGVIARIQIGALFLLKRQYNFADVTASHDSQTQPSQKLTNDSLLGALVRANTNCCRVGPRQWFRLLTKYEKFKGMAGLPNLCTQT
jgi:hypothetical protein